MNEVILLKDGELALKGLNRSTFESVMLKNLRHSLRKTGGEYDIRRAQSTTVVEPLTDDCDMDAAAEAAGRLLGIVAYTRAAKCEKDMDVILPTAREYLTDQLTDAKTFKVEAKRSDKKFPLKSPDIQREVGGYLLSRFPHLTVDVHDPDVKVTVEIRDQYAFIHGNQLPGAGGIPAGTGGHGCILISGGIDSPVAAYLMAKRGVRLTAVHFASPPYTSVLAEKKVHDLLEAVSRYSGRITLYTVRFTQLQEKIRDEAPRELFTVTMRRLMMRIAGQIARDNGCGCLITGESLGQVASQTMEAIACTDDAAPLPVLRPCIGLDKSEIIEYARRIETFETSIQPYEDCCTVFTPKHPKTRPTVAEARDAEAKILDDDMLRAAVETAKKLVIA